MLPESTRQHGVSHTSKATSPTMHWGTVGGAMFRQTPSLLPGLFPWSPWPTHLSGQVCLSQKVLETSLYEVPTCAVVPYCHVGFLVFSLVTRQHPGPLVSSHLATSECYLAEVAPGRADGPQPAEAGLIWLKRKVSQGFLLSYSGFRHCH